MRISDWSADLCSSEHLDSGGKLVEYRLFRVVVSHGKVGSDALCILLNFLWADKATVRHEPQRINASGNAHKRERGDFVHSLSLSCRRRNQHDSRGDQKRTRLNYSP